MNAKPCIVRSLPTIFTVSFCVGLFVWTLPSVQGTSDPPSSQKPAEIIVSIIGGSETEGRDGGFRALTAAYQRIHPEVRVIVEDKGNGYGVGYPEIGRASCRERV